MASAMTMAVARPAQVRYDGEADEDDGWMSAMDLGRYIRYVSRDIADAMDIEGIS